MKSLAFYMQMMVILYFQEGKFPMNFRSIFSMDDTMKVWDIRNPSKALAEFSDLPNFGDTKLAFSPDRKLVMTGTAVK